MTTEGQTAAPAPFAVGDVVRLKSGGPSMTVIKVGPGEGLTCAGFVGASPIEMKALPAALTAATASDR